ncbi:MAG: peptide chain release factor 1 [Bifidobacteriaceae bacterium]|jgi:peptide chain release factor 1|nr:peptide chain release factor 1 [Bifidobacteriaceae bacterium]
MSSESTAPDNDFVNSYEAAEIKLKEYEDIEKKLSLPETHNNQDLSRSLGRKYAALKQIVQIYKKYKSLKSDICVAKELSGSDSGFIKEVNAYEKELENVESDLKNALIPKDLDDQKDAIMEIKAGVGGEESALFAFNLYRMYEKYANSKGWKMQVLDMQENSLGGGIKDATIIFRGKADASPEEGVWHYLKYEGGVHRVQRVPATESQGRIHTSAVGILVYPEADELEEDFEIDSNDLKIDVFRSSGPGGQSVNTTDSAVRLTHLPTGIVVSMQNEKSQIQNKAAALRVLKSRLYALKKEEAESKAADMRKSQVKTLDRSEKIRTYNFPENRIVDHRTGYKSYNLDQVLDGDLGNVIDSAIKKDNEFYLQASGK